RQRPQVRRGLRSGGPLRADQGLAQPADVGIEVAAGAAAGEPEARGVVVHGDELAAVDAGLDDVALAAVEDVDLHLRRVALAHGDPRRDALGDGVAAQRAGVEWRGAGEAGHAAGPTGEPHAVAVGQLVGAVP